jgi:hypothetical protein
LNFRSSEIRTVEIADLGTIVSVTLNTTVDSGSTTFSVLIPRTQLIRQQGASAHIQTEGITTVHRAAILPMFQLGQDDLYTTTPLRGTASLMLIVTL